MDQIEKARIEEMGKVARQTVTVFQGMTVAAKKLEIAMRAVGEWFGDNREFLRLLQEAENRPWIKTFRFGRIAIILYTRKSIGEWKWWDTWTSPNGKTFRVGTVAVRWKVIND